MQFRSKGILNDEDNIYLYVIGAASNCWVFFVFFAKLKTGNLQPTRSDSIKEQRPGLTFNEVNNQPRSRPVLLMPWTASLATA